MIKQRWLALLLCLSLIVCYFQGLGYKVSAADPITTIDVVSYQSDSFREDDEADSSWVDFPIVTNMVYGNNALGTVYLSGSISKEGVYDNTRAFGLTNNVSFGYSYDGSYLSTKDEEWHICSDSGLNILGVDLTKNRGTVVIQKSNDGETWIDAVEPITDFFNKNKDGNNNIYTTIDQDQIDGTYFRVVVMYKMERKIGEEGKVIKTPVYEYRRFAEVYSFFVSSEERRMEVKNLTTRESLSSGQIVTGGFYIEKHGSKDRIIIRKDTGRYSEVVEYIPYLAPGKYVIEEQTKLGTEYTINLTISEGYALKQLAPDVFESENDKGYPITNPVYQTVFGTTSFTNLYIAQSDGFSFGESTKTGYPAYGIGDGKVYIFMKLREDAVINEWNVNSDSWGKREKEKVNDLYVGPVGEGALIIQTSKDGQNWKNVSSERYADGLYTTDFCKYYNLGENIIIYTPDGSDILNGVYIRILFAYEVCDQSKKYKDYLEQYEFYLCSDELDAVTFHNLTLSENDFEEYFGSIDENLMGVYNRAETLTSGSCSTTGFKIDTSLNPSVKYSVYKNGVYSALSPTGEYTAEGKYEIILENALGETKTITLYIDKGSKEEAFERYFGEKFLDGKRVFTEDTIPTFEGGLVEYHLNKVGDTFLPLQGSIENLDDPTSSITIDGTRSEKNGIISAPGTYCVTLTTAGDNTIQSGDIRQYTFNFRIIANGTATGPKVNQDSLREYSRSDVSDSYPIYYSLTYQGDGGLITLAFATEKEAYDYAVEYEKGLVEVQEDGTYKYIGTIEDNWDLNDVIDETAKNAIGIGYFDLSDEKTYVTLSDDVIQGIEDLINLKISGDVIIFAEGQKELLTAMTSSALPFLNDKPFQYLNPGPTGTVENGVHHFEFVSDENGYDSDGVFITGPNGIAYPIDYKNPVYQQLADQGCLSGEVTITEQTCYASEYQDTYNDIVDYKAIFLRDSENTSIVNLSLHYHDGDLPVGISQKENGSEYTCNGFSFNSIDDQNDPYNLIIISHDGTNEFFCADQIVTDSWTKAGKYTIKIVNRLGFFYTFSIVIDEETTMSEVIESNPEIDSIAQTSEESIPVPEDSQNISSESSRESDKPTGVGIGIGAGCVAIVAVVAVLISKRRKLNTNNQKTKEE